MKIYKKNLTYKTKEFLHFLDITNDVQKAIQESSAMDGMVLIYSYHTTAAIRINEKEKGLVKDFKLLAKRIAPKETYYHHNDLTIRTENLVCDKGASDCLNGHSHMLHLLMGATSETVPVAGGKLVLGTWQRIFLVELDVARKRNVLVKVLGE